MQDVYKRQFFLLALLFYNADYTQTKRAHQDHKKNIAPLHNKQKFTYIIYGERKLWDIFSKPVKKFTRLFV